MPKIEKKNFLKHPGFYYKWDNIFSDIEREAVVDELSYQEKCDIVWKNPWFLPRIPDPDQRMFDLATKSYGMSMFDMNCGNYHMKRNKMNKEWYKTRDRRRELLKEFGGKDHETTNNEYVERYKNIMDQETNDEDIEYVGYKSKEELDKFINEDCKLIFETHIQGGIFNCSVTTFGNMINDFEGIKDFIENTGYYNGFFSGVLSFCHKTNKLVINDPDSISLKIAIQMFPDYLYLISHPHPSIQLWKWEDTGLPNKKLDNYDIVFKYLSKNRRLRKK